MNADVVNTGIEGKPKIGLVLLRNVDEGEADEEAKEQSEHGRSTSKGKAKAQDKAQARQKKMSLTLHHKEQKLLEIQGNFFNKGTEQALLSDPSDIAKWCWPDQGWNGNVTLIRLRSQLKELGDVQMRFISKGHYFIKGTRSWENMRVTVDYVHQGERTR